MVRMAAPFLLAAFFAPAGNIAITPDGTPPFVTLPTPEHANVLERIDVTAGKITNESTLLAGPPAVQSMP